MLVGIGLRCAATRGELWLDELWSILKVSELPNPFDIVTKVKHDNNHILNSLWIWLWGATQPALIYRIPALICSAVLIVVLFTRIKPDTSSDSSLVWWIALIVFSFPLTLYGTEARGYSLALLCAVLAYLSIKKLLSNPFDQGAIATFALCGIVGCLSHAVYSLFLAPSVAWLLWQLTATPLKRNSRVLLWCAVAPPACFASLLTLTFYRGMEIGGAPLVPYLEIAATAISASFGGEALSATNIDVTGWCAFLSLCICVVCLSELIAWWRSGDPLSSLVTLIVATPIVAVLVIQPHFILARYFIIQILFLYLIMARFLARLAHQGNLGRVLALVMVVGYCLTNLQHTLELIGVGRSPFVHIFGELAKYPETSQLTVGGDQDFQNGLRMTYAQKIVPDTSRLRYVPTYRTSELAPHFVIREAYDRYEELPDTWTSPKGIVYRRIQRYRAPVLSSSHVSVYEIDSPRL